MHISWLILLMSQAVFPFLCLLISGGHTQIIRVDDPMNFEIIGRRLMMQRVKLLIKLLK